MILCRTDRESVRDVGQRPARHRLRFWIALCILVLSCVGLAVVRNFHSFMNAEVLPGISLTPSDPYTVLAQADHLLWRMNFARAEPLYARAEAFFRDTNNQRDEIYARIGRLAAQTESAPRAEISAELEQLLRMRLVRSDPRLKLWCLAAKAYADTEYDPASAERLWAKVLETAKALNDPPWATRAEGELGILNLLLKGNRPKATRLFGHAFFTTVLNGDIAGQIRFLGILGNGLNELRHYGEALALFDRAIRLAQENRDSGFPFLSYEGKAEALLAQAKLTDSRQTLQQALDAAVSQQNGTHEAALRVLLGRLDAAAGDRQRAFEHFQAAAQTARRLNLYRMLADANFELARLYTRENSPDKAKPFLELAIASSHKLGDLYFPPREFSELAALNAELGHLTEADLLYRQAEDFIDRHLEDMPAPYWQTGLRDALSETYVQHFKIAADQGKVAAAFQIVERVRGRAMAANLANRNSNRGPSSRERDIERQIGRTQLRVMQSARASDQSPLLDKLSVLEQQLAFTANQHTAAHMNRFQGTDLASIQNSLRSDEQVLEYVLAEPASFCISITKDCAEIAVLPEGRAAIEQLADEYLSRIRAKEAAIEPAKKLYSMLLAPLESSPLKMRLIVVADGKLHFVPFESLIDDAGQFLIASHVISYAPSSSLLHQLRMDHRTEKPTHSMLAVGGALYERSLPAHLFQQPFRALEDLFAAHLENLPRSKDEVLNIAKILPDRSKLLLDANATETAFKAQRLRDFSILHLALHAVADAEFPDRAALVFGQDNNPDEDGLLQAREIMSLRLRAELVTLSACATAFGKLEGEEGISNLEQAFFVAGARAVVASLWMADDSITAALMERFYRHLVEGQDKAQALRQAKLDLLRKYGNGAAPFYWAGFILDGEGSSSIALR